MGEVWCRRKSGAIFPLSMSLSAIRATGGSIAHFVGIVYDITQAKRAANRLERLAHYDILTGLPNRALFRDRLEQAMVQAARRRERVALFFLDLDNFKAVNDSLGHAAGDTLLMLVAERLRKAVRQSDTLSRIAGDEFTVVLTDSQDIGLVTEVADRMLESLARPFSIEGDSIRTSASIGIALFPADSEDPDDLMAKADTAMYRAKDAGRNRFCLYSTGLNAPAR
jgi:diguanylate cyclase (GGDEF)-like protein